METLVNLDQQLFLYLNNLGSPNFDAFWLTITNKFSSIPLYILLVYLLYKNFGWKSMLIALLVTTLMITITDQFSYAIKHAVERLRPCREPELAGLGRYITRCGSFGYFSGHATSSFALAVYLSLIFKNTYKYFFAFLIIWALFVSYSRIYVGVHYPGDVITGMLVGSGIGLSCYFLFKYAKSRILKANR